MVDHDAAVALVLRPHKDDEALLEIASVPLPELIEQTLELIGTNVNGNPYGKLCVVGFGWVTIDQFMGKKRIRKVIPPSLIQSVHGHKLMSTAQEHYS